MGHAQETYYKGKTARFLINLSAGGPTAGHILHRHRRIARYMLRKVASCEPPEYVAQE
jgi:hypothetical protein